MSRGLALGHQPTLRWNNTSKRDAVALKESPDTSRHLALPSSFSGHPTFHIFHSPHHTTCNQTDQDKSLHPPFRSPRPHRYIEARLAAVCSGKYLHTKVGNAGKPQAQSSAGGSQPQGSRALHMRGRFMVSPERHVSRAICATIRILSFFRRPLFVSRCISSFV